MQSINSLVIRACNLGSLKQVAEQFRNLVSLDISNNMLKDFQGLRDFPALQSLICDNCGLTQMSLLPKMPQLQSLTAQYNSI